MFKQIPYRYEYQWAKYRGREFTDADWRDLDLTLPSHELFLNEWLAGLIEDHFIRYRIIVASDWEPVPKTHVPERELEG